MAVVSKATLKAYFDTGDTVTQANMVDLIDSLVREALVANLDVAGFSIVSASNGDIIILPNGSGDVIIDGLKHPQADGLTGQHQETDGAGQLSYANQQFPLPPYVTGRYYYTIPAKESTNLTMAANTLYGMYFFLHERSQAFDRISVEIITAQAGKTMRMGIYNVGTDGLPGSLVADSGTVSIATTGGKDITITETLSQGWYMLAFVVDSTTAVMEQFASTGFRILGTSSSTDGLKSYVTVVHAFGALPDPFGSPTYVSDNYVPKIGLRAG